MKIVTRVLLLLYGLMAAPSFALAQNPPQTFGDLSIEDLMNIEVTAASRKEQRAADVAAAVFVITHEDIRRSGMTTIPDLLRLAPGVNVAQINANKWAVSVRGFSRLYANKLLVLVDGRSIYNRLFSGVLWDTQDLLLDDIDRIEVIRGPGAALWGANAVNGVINIVTKSTADTQGVLARVDVGRVGMQGAVRYGGTFGATRYRLYSQWTGRDQSLIVPGTRANDASHSVTTGARGDWSRGENAVILDGAFSAGQARALWPNLDPDTAASEPRVNVPSDLKGGHILGRWTHTRPDGSSLQVQSFLDFADRQEPVGTYQRHSFDIDTQYHTTIGARQDVVGGAGYRFIGERFDGGVGFLLTPPEGRTSLATAFVQDEIALFGRRLAVTLGTQIQYDSAAGAGIQPTARVMWKGFPRQRLWAATSRALRPPSLYEQGIRVDLPPVSGLGPLPVVVRAVGNPATQTETLLDAEAGYRVEIGTASIDVTGFVGRYELLHTDELLGPELELTPSPRIVVTSRFDNQLSATTRGLEIAGQWAPRPFWRLDGSYTAFHISPKLAVGSQDLTAAGEDGSAPRTQWQLRSVLAPAARASLAVGLFHVGRLQQFQIPAYTRTDASLEWRFTTRLSAMAIGQNIFDAAHPEFGGGVSLLLPTQVARSASLRLRWTLP